MENWKTYTDSTVCLIVRDSERRSSRKFELPEEGPHEETATLGLAGSIRVEDTGDLEELRRKSSTSGGVPDIRNTTCVAVSPEVRGSLTTKFIPIRGRFVTVEELRPGTYHVWIQHDRIAPPKPRGILGHLPGARDRADHKVVTVEAGRSTQVRLGPEERPDKDSGKEKR